jgi:hypothetical protein
MDVKVKAHRKGSKMVREYFRKPSGRSAKYLKAHALWEKEKDPAKKKEFESMLHIITAKAAQEQLGIHR